MDYASEIQLSDGAPIGQGQFGSVFRGLYQGQHVAVKMLPKWVWVWVWGMRAVGSHCLVLGRRQHGAHAADLSCVTCGSPSGRGGTGWRRHVAKSTQRMGCSALGNGLGQPDEPGRTVSG